MQNLGKNPAFLFAAVLFLLASSSCSGRSPVEPSEPKGGGQLELRVRDVSGGGGGNACVEDPADPTRCQRLFIPTVITLTLQSGSTLTFTSCRTFAPLVLPMQFTLGFPDGCQLVGTGQFEGAAQFGTLGLGLDATPLLGFQLATGTALNIQIGITLRNGQNLLIDGTLSTQITTLITTLDCPADQVTLDAEFSGTLPHLGRVHGTIIGGCPVLGDL